METDIKMEKLVNYHIDYVNEKEDIEIKLSYKPFNSEKLEERLIIVSFITNKLGEMIDNLTALKSLIEVLKGKYEELIQRSISFSKDAWLEREAQIELLKIINQLN